MKMRTVAYEIKVREDMGDKVIEYTDYTREDVPEHISDDKASDYAVHAYIEGLDHRDFESVTVVRQLTDKEIPEIFED